MSQKKVDQYKEYKSNRKEILEKEKKKKKTEKMIYTIVAAFFVVIIAGGLGLTGYNSYQKHLAARPDYNREELVISDLAGVLAEDEAEVVE